VKEQPGWTLDAVRQHLDLRLTELRHDLEGFPEHYATSVEVETLRGRLESVYADHIGRVEFDRAIEPLRAEQERASGRRTTFVGVLGVLLTVTTFMWAMVVNQQLDHADVSSQIQNEAPWVKDRPQVEQELRALRAKTTEQATQIAQMQQTIRFFCTTRTKAGLSGC